MSALAIVAASQALAARYADNLAIPDDGEVTILLVDDDKVDRMVVRRSLTALKITNPVVEAADGIKALAVLRGENGGERLRRPFIVLLDLHMPRMDGIEFLEEAFGDPALQPMLVFVMTSSPTEAKRLAAHARNIAGYVAKDLPGQGVLMALAVAAKQLPVLLPN